MKRFLSRPGRAARLLLSLGPPAIFAAIAAFAILAIGAPTVFAADVIDRILIRVNSRVITQSAFDLRVAQTLRDAPKGASEKQLADTRKNAMLELVNEALLEDRARELDLLTTDAEVEDYIKRLKEQNQVKTDEEFVRALEANGLTVEKLREQLRGSLTGQRVTGREVYSKVDLSEDALRIVYEREKESWRLPEQVRLSEILVPRGADGAETKVAEVARLVKSGAKFEDVVSKYSSGATRDRAGDLGYVSKGELNPEIDKVVFSMSVGAVSDPIATKFGWHVVKLIDKVPAGYKPFAEVKAEILKREQETQFQKKLAEYLEKLSRDAVIKVSPEAAMYYTAPVAVTPPPEVKPVAKPAGKDKASPAAKEPDKPKG